MATVMEVEVLVQAPLEDVWRVVGDFGGIAKYAPELKSSRLESSAVEVGAARSCELTRPMFGAAVVREEVTAYEPGRLLSYRVLGALGPFASARNTLTLHPEGPATRVVSRGEFVWRWQLLGWIVGPFVGPALHRLARRTLERMQHAVEEAV